MESIRLEKSVKIIKSNHSPALTHGTEGLECMHVIFQGW